MHPVARFMLPLLEHHNKEGFETFAYYTRMLRDGITDECKKRVDHWRDTHGKSEEELAALIRRDQIDILVDLTMHSRDCKPGLFARKPAPVQVSYLAYGGTTGLEAISYRLTDIHLDPPGQPTPGFHEEPLRLPVCWWNFQLPPEPHVRMPEVQPPPCLKNGYVTFGSLNNFVKVNPVTRLAWARLVTRGEPLAVEIIDIELELAKVLMGEFANLQIKQHITLEHGMVKDQIDVKMVAVEGEALLAGDKGKALAQFEQEGLQLAEEGGFQLRLDQLGGGRDFQKFEHQRIFEHIERPDDFLTVARQSQQTFLVAAGGEAVVKQAVDLTLQFAGGPAVLDGFDLVEGPGLGQGDAEQVPVQ